MKKIITIAASLALCTTGAIATTNVAEAAPRCTYRVNNNSVAPYVDGTCTGVLRHRTVAWCWPGFRQRGDWVASGKTSRANCPFVYVTDKWSDYIYNK